jgi:hypothetical protein
MCAVAVAVVALLVATRGLLMAGQPAAPSTATTGAIYTCPMHPQIQWNQPVACPLCGMALKLKTSAQAPSATPGTTGSMHMHHSQQDAMGMNGCMECMQMMGMGGTNMPGMNGSGSAAPQAGSKIVAPASMRMGCGRGCGC